MKDKHHDPKRRKAAELSADRRIKEGSLRKEDRESYIRGYCRLPSNREKPNG